MHEIITLQFGHYSNFVGTHYWNAQDAYFTYNDSPNSPEPEIIHDIHFRTGISQKGIETYTPRVIIYDLKGGFGQIKKMNKLYEDFTTTNYSKESYQLWNWEVETYSQMPYPKNEFLRSLDEEEEKAFSAEPINDDIEIDFEEKNFNLNETVKTWSDFNRIYYHPQSVYTITEFQHDDEFSPFDVFTYGKNVFSKNKNGEENSFEKNFRFFAEECDSIQGFQVIVNTIDGFGGCASNFLEQLREEYPKNTILSFGITESPKLASSPENVNFIHMRDLVNRLTWRGNTKIGILDLIFPFPISEFGDIHFQNIISKNIKNGISIDLSMSQVQQIKQIQRIQQVQEQIYPPTIFGQSVVIRGIPNTFNYVSRRDNPKKSTDITTDIFQQYKSLKSEMDFFYSTNLAYPIPNSFPKIFKNLNSNGYVDEFTNSSSLNSVKSIPTLSRLTVSTQVQELLKLYTNLLQKINFNLFPEFQDGVEGLSHDEFIETRESLYNLCGTFENDHNI
ncbi:4069_t:CDS:10 [Diversispora eburnea]|uniref:4069_t:CDS:1 n=1 Tax=Diversispora eburnea TaxID=1213867 RepID=A0A9N9APH7_9GLOM|nr:4069_t:CDS:10 [Diversispora eburnea]